MTHESECLINCLIVTPLIILLWEVAKITIIEKIKSTFFVKNDEIDKISQIKKELESNLELVKNYIQTQECVKKIT